MLMRCDFPFCEIFSVSVFSSVTEMVGVEYRRTVGILFQMILTVGMLLLTLLAYLIPDWRWLQVVISVPYLLFVSYYWYEPLYSCLID